MSVPEGGHGWVTRDLQQPPLPTAKGPTEISLSFQGCSVFVCMCVVWWCYLRVSECGGQSECWVCLIEQPEDGMQLEVPQRVLAVESLATTLHTHRPANRVNHRSMRECSGSGLDKTPLPVTSLV